jgi:hypothetical protein
LQIFPPKKCSEVALAPVVAAAAAAAAAQVTVAAAAAGLVPLPPVVESRHRQNRLEEHIPLGNFAESCTGKLSLCATCSCQTDLRWEGIKKNI